MQTCSTAGRGSSGKIDLYGIKKLRELILELAVRGKLVPQDPNDEPASELLKRIAAEKAELVKQGKIKKQNHCRKLARKRSYLNCRRDGSGCDLVISMKWSTVIIYHKKKDLILVNIMFMAPMEL